MTTPVKRKDYGTILVAVTGIMMFAMLLMYVAAEYGGQFREFIEILSRHNEEEFEAYVRAGGILKGMGIIAAAVAIQVVSIIIPGMVINVVAGVIYGWWEAFIVCYLAFIVANFVVYWIVRTLAGKSRSFQNYTISPRLMNRLKNSDPVFTIAVCYLVPGVPNGIVPHIAAHYGLTPKQFLIAVSSTVWIQILINCSIGHFLIRGQFIYMFLSFGLQFFIIYVVNNNKEAVMELFEKVFRLSN